VSDEAIQFFFVALDCFAEPVIGPAKPDPLARNDGTGRAAIDRDAEIEMVGTAQARLCPPYATTTHARE
jgi:hypothetical protein